MLNLTMQDSSSNSAKKKILPEGTVLLHMNLEDAYECELLRLQRVACGWKADAINKWRIEARRGERNMFWIAIFAGTMNTDTVSGDDTNYIDTSVTLIRRHTEETHEDNANDLSETISSPYHDYIPAGHCSLDRVDHDHNPPDLSLANPSLLSPILTITNLYILPKYAGLGLAAFAIGECEKFAQSEPYGHPACHTITLNTVNRSNVAVLQSGKWNTGAWYERLGYVPYKEVAIEDSSNVFKAFIFYRKTLVDKQISTKDTSHEAV